LPLDVDRQTLPAVLVDHGKHPERLAVIVKARPKKNMLMPTRIPGQSGIA